MKWIAASLLAACSSARPPSAPIANTPGQLEAPPRVAIVAVNDRKIRFLDTTPSGLAETRTVLVPAAIIDEHWTKRAMFVQLDLEAPRAGEVGEITAAGYVALPRPDEQVYAAPPPPPGSDNVGVHWRLATTQREVWLGRCEWGTFADGIGCTEWTYARLRPEPMIVQSGAPDDDDPDEPYALPVIAPSRVVRPELVDDSTAHDEPRQVLRCTSPTETTEYPPAAERGDHNSFAGISDIEWLATDPPVFRVQTHGACLEGICAFPILFEGCAPSQRYAGASVIAGPAEMTLIHVDDRTSVRWRGRQVATIEHAERVHFAPAQ